MMGGANYGKEEQIYSHTKRLRENRSPGDGVEMRGQDGHVGTRIP